MSRTTRIASLIAGATMMAAPFIGTFAAHAEETNTLPNSNIAATIDCPPTMPRHAAATCRVSITNDGPEDVTSVSVNTTVTSRDATVIGGCGTPEGGVSLNQGQGCFVGTVQVGETATHTVTVWVGDHAEHGDPIAVGVVAYPVGEDQWVDNNADTATATVA